MRPDRENRLAYICSQSDLLQPRGYTMSTRTTTTVVNNRLSSSALADNLVHALARPAADSPEAAYTVTARTLHWITAVLSDYSGSAGLLWAITGRRQARRTAPRLGSDRPAGEQIAAHLLPQECGSGEDHSAVAEACELQVARRGASQSWPAPETIGVPCRGAAPVIGAE
jgi:hypothetical protein